MASLDLDSDALDAISMGEVVINVASWNIAAVYNNPFEYWISHKNPEYDTMMIGVQNFIDSREKDFKISEIEVWGVVYQA